MPTRQQTIADAIQIFESADYPSGLNPTTAWLGLYQTLLWYEPVNLSGFGYLPHIIDADKLRPSSHRSTRNNATPWQIRAQAFDTYLATQLECPSSSLPSKTDLLMKHSNYIGMQRQNTLGIAFAGLIKHIVEKFGSKSVIYRTEVEASAVFSGITFPGRSSTPRMDVLIEKDSLPRAIISAKWSVRHDRLNDITNECPVYKSSYERIYRRSGRNRLLFYVMTNEYDPARLSKILDDDCVDGVVHVHKVAVIQVCGLNGRLTRLIDLAEFTEATSSW